MLGFARGPEDIRAVVRKLRNQGIQVTGPYEIPKGTLVYTLADGIVTERELLDLAKAGKLDAAGVSEFTARIMKNGAAWNA
jgi:diketogulonate reductase-like aldo/keto reductase